MTKSRKSKATKAISLIMSVILIFSTFIPVFGTMAFAGEANTGITNTFKFDISKAELLTYDNESGESTYEDFEDFSVLISSAAVTAITYKTEESEDEEGIVISEPVTEETTLNSGSVIESVIVKYIKNEVDDSAILPDLAINGYTFEGWDLINKDGGHKVFLSAIDVQNKEENTEFDLIPVFSCNTLTIKVYDGYSCINQFTVPYNTSIEEMADVITLDDEGDKYVKDGYKLTGVENKDTLEDIVFGEDGTKFTEDTSLKLIWTPIEYSVIFDIESPEIFEGYDEDDNEVFKAADDIEEVKAENNSGEELISNGKEGIKYGVSFSLPKVVADGYTFYGWDLITTEDGEEFHSIYVTTAKNLTIEDEDEVTIVPVFTQKTYTITYNISWMGIAGKSNIIVKSDKNSDGDYAKGKKATIAGNGTEFSDGTKLNTENKPGYTFIAWSTSSAASYKDKESDSPKYKYFEAGSEYTFAGDNLKSITLFPVWKPIIYTIKYATKTADGEEIDLAEYIKNYSEESKELRYSYEDTFMLAGGKSKDGTNEIAGYKIYYINGDGDAVYLTHKVKDEETNVFDVNTYLCKLVNKSVDLICEPIISTCKYSVIYNPNGGKINEASTVEAKVKAAVGETVNLYDEETVRTFITRKGYTFEGWYVDGTSKEIIYSIEMGNSDITVYAKWKPIKYGIIIKYTEFGIETLNDKEFVTEYGKTFTLPTYYEDEAGNRITVFEKDDTRKIIGDYTLYDADGELLGTYTAGSVVSDLYDALQDGAETAFVTDKDGEEYEAIVFYAIPADKEFTVNFNANGGTYKSGITSKDATGKAVYGSNEVTIKKGTDEETKISLTAKETTLYIREGYTFEGWSFSASSESDLITEEYITKDTTVYAIWKPISYKIVINYSGAENKGFEISDYIIDAVYDKSYTLPGIVYIDSTGKKVTLTQTDAYAKLSGYKDSANKTYKVSSSVKNLTKINGAEITFYATYTPIEFTMTFNAYGGKFGTSATAATTTKLGASGTKITYESGFTFPGAPATPKKGYTFAGWARTSSGKAASITDKTDKDYIYKAGEAVGANTVTKNMTFYARWTPVTYKVVIKYGQGNADVTRYMKYASGTTYSDSKCTKSAGSLTLKNMKKTGLIIKDYKVSGGDLTGKTYVPGKTLTNLASKANATVTITANWVKTHHSVTLNYNGGTNSSGAKTVKASKATNAYTGGIAYGSTFTLSASYTPKARTGYTFAGWNTQANGKGTTYKAGSKVTITKDITLYAIWKANTYKVKFVDKTTNKTVTVTATYGKYVTMKNYLKARKGYTFVGWSKTNGGSSNYTKSKSYTVSSVCSGLANNGTLTLYAVWKKNK